MSLLIWLPLDGDLRNLGCDSLNYINVQSGVNIDNNGKIGKCYTNTSTKTSIANSCILSSSAFTVCTWAKINSKRSNWSCFLGMRGNGTYLSLGCEHTNGTLLGFHFYKTIDGTNTSIFDIYPTDVKLDTWVHYTMCYDGLKYYIYENGQLISSNSVRIPNTEVNMTNLYLFGRYSNEYSSCSLNDVRIYDHCLSAAEVREISQGLVLHYELNGPMNGMNPNLLNGTLNNHTLANNRNSRKTGQFENLSGGNGAVSIIEDLSVPIGKYAFSIQNNTSGNKDFAQYGGDMPFALIEGKQYTISAYYKGTGTSLLRIWDYTTNKELTRKTTTLPSNAASEWVRISYTFTATSIMNTNNIGCLIGITGTSNVIMCGFKLEKSEQPTEYCCSTWDLGIDETIVEDASGYGHNGTVNSTISYEYLQGGRYSTQAYIGNETPQSIDTPNIMFENMQQGTLNIWINRKSFDTNWRLYTFFANGYNWTGREYDFLIIGSTGGQTITLDCCSNTYSFTPDLNKWYMYTISWDLVTHTAKMYVNGELKSIKVDDKIDTTYASKHNLHYFGNRNLNNSTYTGDYLLSDARIYCTPLLDNDIKLLYNTSVKVNKLGGIHSFTLEENVSPLLDIFIASAITRTYDKATNTYTLDIPSTTGTQQLWYPAINRTINNHSIECSWNTCFIHTVEICSNKDISLRFDFNNFSTDSNITLSGNDNDNVAKRYPTSPINLTANQWETITYKYVNSNETKNPNHVSLYDVSYTYVSAHDEAFTLQLRNPITYVIDETTNALISKTGILNYNQFIESSLIKQASINKRQRAINAAEFIES